MEFLWGKIVFFIVAIGEYGHHLSETESVSVSLRDRAIFSRVD